MVDAPATVSPAHLLHGPAVIKENIPVEQIGELLDALSRSYDYLGVNPIPNIETTQRQNFIQANWFPSDVAHDQNEFLYVDPAEENRQANRPNVLSRFDTVALIQSIAAVIRKKQGTPELLPDFNATVEQQTGLIANYQRILLNQFPKNRSDLKIVIDQLREIYHALLPATETVVEETTTQDISAELPSRLTAISNLPRPTITNAPQSSDWPSLNAWPSIRTLLEDIEATAVAHPDQPANFVQITPEQTLVQVPIVRKLINDWLTKITEEHNALPRWRQIPNFPLSPPQYLPAVETGYPFDEATITSNDITNLDLILRNYDEVIVRYLNNLPTQPAGYTTTAQANTAEGGDPTDLTKKNDDELLTLIDQLGKANLSYAQEAARLNAILLPQFFRLNGLDADLGQLAQFDPVNFGVIQREFSEELEHTLRSLPADFLDDLKPGDTLQFRLKVIRALHARLSTNPTFLTNLQAYKTTYSLTLGSDVAKQEYDAFLNRDAEEFDRNLVQELSSSDKTKNPDWADENSIYAPRQTEGQAKEASEIQRLLNLRSATSGDYRRLFDTVLKGHSDTVLANLNLIIAEQWSPERLDITDPNIFQLVFGFPLPAEFGNQPELRGRFLALAREYILTQRERYADFYKVDAISRAADRDNKNQPLTQAELDHFAQTKALADSLGEGGDEVVVAARSQDQESLEELREREDFAKIQAAFEAARAEREADLQRQLSELDRAAQLALLGVTAAESQAMTQQLLESELNRYARNYVANTSYYESKQGLVQQNGRTIRRGNAGQAASLLSNKVKAFNTVQKWRSAISSAKGIGSLIEERGEQVLAGMVAGPLAFAPKEVRRAGLAAVGGIAIDTYAKFSQGGLNAIGGIAGGGAGMASGPIGGFWGWVTGTQGAAAGQQSIGQIGQGVLGAIRNIGGSGGGSGVGAAAGAAGGQGAVGVLTAKVASGIKTLIINPYVPYVAGTCAVGTTCLMAMANMNTFMPALPTVNEGNQESKYVTIEKHALPTAPGMKFEKPGTFVYGIRITPKVSKITITNITDEMTVEVNPKKNTTQKNGPVGLAKTPAPGWLGTQSTEVTRAQPLDLAAYEVAFPASYSDSNVTNVVTITYTAVDENGTAIKENNSEILTAKTAEVLCFGDCPQQQAGCWPVSGVITQTPYQPKIPSIPNPSHANEDAFDIAGAAIFNQKVYAPASGRACKRNEAGYGKHVDLTILSINGIVNQTLRFAHLFSYGEDFEGKDCIDAIAGKTVLGHVGNDGNSTGAHLHFEVVPGGGSSANSSARKFVPNGANVSVGQFVRSCYDGTASQ